MDLSTILIIAVIVALVIVLFKVIKHAMKALMLLAVLFILATAVIGYLAYRDAMDLQQNLGTKPKLMLLRENDAIIAGFIDNGQNKSPEFLTSTSLQDYQAAYARKDYQSMLKDRYKIFILEKKAFETTSGSVDFYGMTASVESLSRIIGAEDSFTEFEGEVGMNPRAYGFTDPTEFKSILFAMLFNDAIQKNTGLFIIMQYQNGNMLIYPETAAFKLMKVVPTAFIQDKINAAAEEFINRSTESARG